MKLFNRYEYKYLIDQSKMNDLISILQNMNMIHEVYHISNLYYDTLDYTLIQKSIDATMYKEKLRLRKYNEHDAFLELKKKYNGIVYKRRIELNSSGDSNVELEIEYMKKRYPDLDVRMYIGYDRIAFSLDDLRITFDSNLIYRDYDLDINIKYGNNIIDTNQALLEIKTSSSMPLWLTAYLSQNKIYKTSFSKYKYAYMKLKEEKNV